jgi:hypothetical protein
MSLEINHPSRDWERAAASTYVYWSLAPAHVKAKESIAYLRLPLLERVELPFRLDDCEASSFAPVLYAY